ncbi:hypothetical protein BC938DRAFT_471272 [Jimgerdemannia flammicorona]|uniref:Uncharacterized protein n=1 Tax=Jimgerdemannia flammicorona TaxID=994334 RepID=A0A433Q8C8_9FUNG|nr:hypothetical protein BC938DRAFT_471272 [Jimgerdemannia flammicorona]
MELLFLETTGHYRLADQLRKGWDHVKEMHGCLAILGQITHLFAHGSVDDFMNIKVVFLHAHDNELHLWTLELSKMIKILEKLKVSHMTNVLVMSLKSKKSQMYLSDFMKPVSVVPNKKTDLTKVASINPGSSSIREYELDD